MRRRFIFLTAAGAVLASASPAAAQYYPGQPFGGGYGYNGYGQARALHARIDRIEWQIDRLDRVNAIPDGAADRLRFEARRLESRLSGAARYGLNPYEVNDIEARIARLEQRVRYASANRFGGYGYGYNGANNYGYYGYRNGRGHWDGDRDDDDRDDD